jgi:hypothetical protein
MKTSIKISLFAVFFIALAGIGYALYLYNLKAKDLQTVKPDFVISAIDLQKAFETDEKGSSAKYINKILEVSGEIVSANPGEKMALNISLRTGSDFSNINCTFPAGSDTTFLKKGNQITLRGECSGFLMDVLLNNCAIIKNY